MNYSQIKDFPNYVIYESGMVINMTTGKEVSISVHKHGHHVVRGGTFGKGSKHQLRKLSLQDIFIIRNMRERGFKPKQIAAEFNVTPRHIYKVCNHKQTIENE